MTSGIPHRIGDGDASGLLGENAEVRIEKAGILP